MKKIKIAMLSPIAWRTPPKNYGPWELVVSNLTEGLVKKGYDVTLFATKDSITEAKHHAICPKGYEEDKNINPAVWKLLHISELLERADDFNLIHNHFDYPLLTYSKLIKTPILTTIHGFSSAAIYPVYEKYNDNVYYVSISDADRYEKLNYVATVYNGINLSEFTFNSHPQDYLVFLGRICYEKGTHEAIQIAKKVNKKLIIAGIIQEQNYFRKKVKPYIDDKQIKFIGPVGPKERDKLLSNAVALLHPVMKPERFGLVMPEAMACGTPVIAFDKGSVKEIIADGKTGFIVNNIEEAVKSLNNINKINREKCRKHVKENFSVEKMVDSYIKIYNEIMDLENKNNRNP